MANSPLKLDHHTQNGSNSPVPSLIETITNELYEGVLVLNGNLEIIFANRTAELLLGQPVQTLQYIPLNEIFPDDQIKLLYRSREQSHRFHTIIEPTDNSPIPACVTLTTLPFTVEGLTVVSIVALPKASQWVDKIIHNERLAGLGTMGASIAHELTNPISVISTTASNLIEMVDGNYLNEETLKRYLKMIDTNVGRCNQLIDTLRAYTYGETLREPTSVNELIGHAVTLLDAQLVKRDNLRLNFELNPELPKVTCDPGQITQVLINLMLNARDALLPAGGEILLKTWPIPEIDSVAVSVQDSGDGLPPEEKIPQLFEPFFTTKSRGRGTGLGLFIASEIVKQHNGWIRAQNRTEPSISGAQFTVMLPI